MSLDPFALDRSITEASRALEAAREGLRDDPEETSARPLVRHDRVSRHDALVELSDLASRRADEPVWAAAVPWVQALALSRATFVDDRREAIARRGERFPVEEPVRAEVTLQEALFGAIEAKSPALAAAWSRVVETSSGPTRGAAVFRSRRRREAARLLGDVDLEQLDVPVAEAHLAGHVAREVLALTDGLQPAAALPWRDAVAVAIASERQEGYPARLTPRWLASVLPPDAFAGLSFDPGPLPRLLGATSVARALASVGARAARVDHAGGLPRCIARAPSDLLMARRAALFGGLVADPTFVRKVLGAARDEARDQAGRAARALAIGLRVAAAKTLLRAVEGAAGTRDAELLERGSDLFGAALGSKVPPALVGVMPRLDPGAVGDGRPSAAAELVGAVIAAADRERLVDALDEDWFRSPRAADTLRHDHHVHRASVRATAEELEAGLAALRRALAPS